VASNKLLRVTGYELRVMGPRNKEKGWRSEAKGKKNIGRMKNGD